MNKLRQFRSSAFRLLAALLAPLCLGCDIAPEYPSHDLSKLYKLVDLGVPVKSAKWEVFSTPEDTGLLPTSPDVIALVAEIEVGRHSTITDGPKSGSVWITPEAARPWLAEPFRSMLKQYEDRSVELSRMDNCRQFKATLQNGRKPLEGIICGQSGKSLIYLTLWNEGQP